MSQGLEESGTVQLVHCSAGRIVSGGSCLNTGYGRLCDVKICKGLKLTTTEVQRPAFARTGRPFKRSHGSTTCESCAQFTGIAVLLCAGQMSNNKGGKMALIGKFQLMLQELRDSTQGSVWKETISSQVGTTRCRRMWARRGKLLTARACHFTSEGSDMYLPFS
jgi:hypothetical protein